MEESQEAGKWEGWGGGGVQGPSPDPGGGQGAKPPEAESVF